MTPEQEIAARLNGIVNRVTWRLDELERRRRMVRPTTQADIEAEERRSRFANNRRGARP